MIKLMIVDDEILTRIGILSMHKWSENGYVIVGEADNGKSALEIAEREQPDIILTDIKMPVMNGIEFIREAHKRGIKSRFVILSTYSEFKYVREGMKMGAVDYLLKLELEPGKLIELLNRISVEVYAERDASPSHNPTEKVYKISPKHIEAKCIYDILTGRFDTPDDIDGALIKAGLMINPENLICIAVQNCKTTSKQQGSADMDIHLPYGKAVIKALKELIGDYGICFGCEIEKHLFCFIVSLNSNIAPAFHTSYSEKIKSDIIEHIKNTFNLSLTVSISSTANNLEEIPVLFRQICHYNGDRYYINRQNTGDCSSEKENGINYTFGDELSRIEDILNSSNIDEFDTLFENVINKIKAHGAIPSKVLHGICQTLIHIMDSFLNKNYYLEHNWNRSSELLYLVKSCKTQEQYISYIQSLNKKLVQYVNSETDYKKVILKAKKYIEQSYQKDISLDSVAFHIGLSPAYFSRLFSKEIGTGFIDYLTNQRIDHAKEYLKKTSKKVNEISELVGYKNPYYFSRIFKKVTGKTPLEYRK